VKAVVVSPIGFISDHMEVIWDLDTELVDAAQELGVQVSRAYTVGPQDSFAAMIVDLIEENTAGRKPEILGNVSVQGCTQNGNPCAAGCGAIWALQQAKTSPYVAVRPRQKSWLALMPRCHSSLRRRGCHFSCILAR